MKKKNFKKLQLKKSSISKLYGGSSSDEPSNVNHKDSKQGDNCWISEFGSACFCPSVRDEDCPRNDNPGPDTNH